MSSKNNSNNTRKRNQSEAVGFFIRYSMQIAILMMLVGLMIRLYRVGYMSLWVDEYMHAMAAVKGKFFHGENNGVLLTWLNTLFSYVAGTSEFALRLPVALLGAACIYVSFRFGKTLFNVRVGLIAAVFCTFSVYMIFWSRVDRPYGIVPAFYTLLLMFFWMTLESGPEKSNKLGINSRFLLFTFVALILSMLSQLICFLFIFSAGFYGTFVSLDNWITKKKSPKQFDAYNLLFYLNIVLVFMMFTPAGSKLSIGILESFLPKNISQFILPDINNIVTSFNGENAYKCYDTYMGVLKTDYKYLTAFAWIGLAAALIKDRKKAYFLISTLVVPFLLMSFVFIKLSHAKYLIYLYPVFLVAAAYGIYYLAYGLLGLIDKKMFSEENKTYALVCNIALLAMVYGMNDREDLHTLLTATRHGSLVSPALSEISFVNWKQPCNYLNEKRKPNDIVMATVQVAPKYYLGLDTVIWFRQMHLNPKWNPNNQKEEKYIENTPDNQPNSATTYEQLVKTYNNNPRGWLLADYYLDNALTDPRAKQFVEQNFNFHYGASDDGGVKVFSWDKSKPKEYPSAFVIELGKNENQMASMPMTINLAQVSPATKMMVMIVAQGIDNNSEAIVQINDKQYAIKKNGDPNKIQNILLEVPSSAFKVGQNSIQFGYNEDGADSEETKGCVIYNLEVR